ncbi:serine hydrolase [Spirosoma sp. KUDC1026]|uniref:serine hydrolase n=1 Tax=Spirosoma sp. KUDC1026 TaxID=2745947 RepID=UPI00159BC4F6|nr:serine hydrolase [Spirosoma sp. KUDC1026]QKZ13843.1 serine hydrolase [Spirosoma sp. KUDC1026]
MNVFKLITCLLITGSVFGQKTPTVKQIQAFDQYVATVQKQWAIPGMSVVVVKDNKVIFSKGYGVREVGRPEPVDTQTLFACASTTKAMTVALMGMLVDEGKLAWSDPVYKYLPELQLYDASASREITIRDLLIHDTGVGGTDFFTGAMHIPVNEMFRRMALVKPSYSIRSGFIYQNIMYSAAGRIIERLMGTTWAEAIQARIFRPLGMLRTVPKRRYIKDDNQVRPHYVINDTIRVIDYTPDSEIGSAGAVWSSADDISKWVTCMLDSSKYNGGRLLKPETWAEVFKTQTLVPNDEYPTMQLLQPNWLTYGLGWYQHDYKGHKINFHTGSHAGLTAITAQLPDEKLGIFAFGNVDHAEGRHALIYKAFDLFALGGTRDWSTEFKTLYEGIKEQNRKATASFVAQRVPNTKPSLALQEYAGTYNSLLYGEITVSLAGNDLSFNANNALTATLPHWHYDTFYGSFDKAWQGKTTAQFSLSSVGKVSTLVFNGMDFKKKR